MNDPRVQAMLKRSRHNNSSFFIINQDYCELPKRTIRANGNICHTFKPNIYRVVQIFYQGKASMDMTLNDYKHLTSTCWVKKYQPLTIDLTKETYVERNRLGLNSFFIPHSFPFQVKNMSIYSNITEQDLIILRNLAEQQKNQRAIKIKKRPMRRTYNIKLAETSSLITKTLEVNETTKKVGEVIKDSISEKDGNQKLVPDDIESEDENVQTSKRALPNGNIFSSKMMETLGALKNSKISLKIIQNVSGRASIL